MAQDENVSEPTVLDRLVITTPLRRESALERSTSSVTVIDEEDIRKSAAPDLPSLLKFYTGVSVTADGGRGANAAVSLRGTKASQTLVLINGVRIASATSGSTSIFNIPLDSIERVEIAKGAHSAQYGSEAIGGVINIVTRQGGACADGRSACGTATVGVMHPWGGYASANVQGEKDGLTYSAGGSILGTRGYDFTMPYAPWGIHEPGDDGFHQGSLHFSLAKEFDWGRLYGDGLFARGRTEYDNLFPFDNEQDTTTFAGKVGTHIDHSADWSSTVELYSGIDRQTNFREGQPNDSRFDTARYGAFASTEKSFEIGGVTNVLTGGVESYRETVDGTVDYEVDARTISSVFAQYSAEYDALTLDSGIRYDHNSQFGGVTTYNIGASYEVTPDITLRSSYATGYRAPTFNDLYYPSTPGFPPASNPNLKPEKSRSWEAGVNWRIGADTTVDLAVYRTFLTDAITLNQDFTPINVGRAEITGFEAQLSHRFSDAWNGSAALDLRRPIDLTTGRYLTHSDRFKATAELTYSLSEQWQLTGRVLYGGSRYIYNPAQEKLPDYVTADFTALYSIDENSRLKIAVENIFDEQYETNYGYRAPGRTFDLSFTRAF
ncbi:MAG: TonB-dependent receptor [Pseudomonadota bacterium]|nr:TonB-dependent receptor [Pseudomonadota bacterium]